MNQKLIFLDIDGTLCVPGSNVPPSSALEAIRKARAAGHLVFLCTGRNLGMLSALLGYGFDGVVGSSGGYVTCGDTFFGAVLHHLLQWGLRDYTEAELHQMLTFANAAAAIITTKKGALRVMPSEMEIRSLISGKAASEG